MNGFLEKHNIDVGRTASVLLFAGMVEEIYKSIFILLGGPGFFPNLGIVVLFFLGRGMWNHNNIARQWCIGLMYAMAALMIGNVALIPFTDAVTIVIGGIEDANPPLWKGAIMLVLSAPLLTVFLLVLHSEKAKREFLAKEEASDPERCMMNINTPENIDEPSTEKTPPE